MTQLSSAPILLWFRLDLRLADNPALHAAVQRERTIIPVFIWAPEEEAPWEPGAASRWWLHQSLDALDERLHALGSRLVLRRGPSSESLRNLLRETRAESVFWNRRCEPMLRARDEKIEGALRDQDCEVETFNAALLHEPSQIQNKAGKPFQVFTPFWKHCLALAEPTAPLPAPKSLLAPARWPRSVPLESFELEPRINWAHGIKKSWEPGETGAKKNVTRFLKEAVGHYTIDRNRPDLRGTSRLSPHLHFGEIGPRQIWHGAKKARVPRSAQYLTELGWREFAHHLLFHFPETPKQPLRTEFSRFRWRHEADWLKQWEKGLTGYPIVDAGMRELWGTGWMHNRVRMIAASFLVKDLLISWESGARWFWDTLVDADLAQNTLGWQWTAGCGADAAPYFRVFNPVLQGEKFDPEGHYVRHWCPEIANLPNRWIHQPWAAPVEVLNEAGIELGRTYPEPIVRHAIVREVALEEYNRLMKS